MFPIVAIGYMGNNIYPARAGEVLRAVVLKRRAGVSVSASLATVIVERVFDGVVMLAFVFLNLPELARLQVTSGFVGSIQTLAIWGALIFSLVLAFFLLEQVLRRRGHLHPGHHLHPVVTINLVGDALHNLIDGMLIGASFVSSPALGLTTTLAVVMHEVPQELGDFGVLVHGGLPARKALVFNLLSALTSVAGAVLALAVGLGDPRFATYLLPVTAGGFIYIAGSDLVPELQRAATSRLDAAAQLALIVLGVAVMALLALAG